MDLWASWEHSTRVAAQTPLLPSSQLRTIVLSVQASHTLENGIRRTFLRWCNEVFDITRQIE